MVVGALRTCGNDDVVGIDVGRVLWSQGDRLSSHAWCVCRLTYADAGGAGDNVLFARATSGRAACIDFSATTASKRLLGAVLPSAATREPKLRSEVRL